MPASNSGVMAEHADHDRPNPLARLLSAGLMLAAILLLFLPVRGQAMHPLATTNGQVTTVRYEAKSCGAAVSIDAAHLVGVGENVVESLQAQQAALSCQTARAERLGWTALMALLSAAGLLLPGRHRHRPVQSTPRPEAQLTA
jgi:hypothetical protein